MNGVGQAAQAGLELLGTAVVHGTALAAATAVLVLLFRRARPALLALLWTIALVKFLAPVAPAAPFALSRVFARGAVATPAEVVVAPSASAPAAELAGGLDSVWPVLATALFALWLSGVLIAALRSLRARRELVRHCRQLSSAPAAQVARVEWAAQRIGAPVPRAVVDPAAAGAYLVGAWKPLLVLPTWAEGERLDAILLHELAHLRRRDPAVRAVQRVVGWLFFFWPPVRWVSRQIDLLREQACDQWAIETGPLGASEYARILVDVAARARRQPAGALRFSPRPGHLERRVVHLLGVRTRPALSVSMAVLGLGWSAAALASAPVATGGPRAELLCATDPRIGAQILASYPDADVDGDGALSMDEICAHQLRMQRRVVDATARTLPDDSLRLADADGDGQISDDELDRFKDRLVVAVTEDATTRQSRLVLQYEPVSALGESNSEPMAWPVSEGLDLQSTEVAGPVCEATPSRCVQDERSARGEDRFLLIDVAVKSGE